MLQASSDSEAGPLTLINIALDLQIIICTLLHPSDILALRETCKTLQFATRQRVVWVAALHRVCIDNSLFLPSFPVLDMSDVELEHAAMGPRRWIELCASLEKQTPNDSYEKLHPRTSRIIEDSSLAAAGQPQLFIVPGGRYMVSGSHHGIFVWDLGYTSSSDCKLIASVGLGGGYCYYMVQATPDGMGLIIFSSSPYEHCSVYEIYPQSEMPQLTRIANLHFDSAKDSSACLLPDRVLWHGFYEDTIVFRVWDYRMNHSISFSADFDLENFDFNIQVIPTKTAIIVLCKEEMLVWVIPPLLPQPPDFFDDNPTHMPSLFGISFHGILNQDKLIGWQTMSHWYCGSSQPLYFDILCLGSKLHRFEIIVKPDLFDTSLRIINTERELPLHFHEVTFQPHSICEGARVICWGSVYPEEREGIYIGLTTSRFTTVIGPAAMMLLPPTVSLAPGYTFFLCPTSGRYAYLDQDICKIGVVDLF